MRKYVLLTSILMLAIFASVSIACAQQTPNYNYDVTNNYHGKDTPLGATVVVTATTDDPGVTAVLFIWRNAAGIQQWTQNVTDIKTVNGHFEAQSSGQPNSIGDWGVQTLFLGPDGKTREQVDYVIAIRGTSFNVIPEVPILGTAGIAGAMAIGWIVKAKRKNTEP
jgi:hypothetical protein